MPFTSYAQNFEDVMLWRALAHVPTGRYIDVGAQHPIIDSVSQAFHERGWRGTHVEPVQQYADLLRQHRPDETVLQVALSDHEGTLELNLIPDTGLTTGIDRYADRHHQERGLAHQKIQVPVTTLKAAFGDQTGQDIHWLKIDVEGFETQVLRGWDSAILRPWILVVEATIPNSSQTDHAGWEPIVTGANYRFVYFDGLNRYYIAEEHEELRSAFAAPPNVFDDILLTEHSPICRAIVQSHLAQEQRMADEHIQLQEANANLSNRAELAETSAVESERRAAHAEEELALAGEELALAQQETRRAQDDLEGKEALLASCQHQLEAMQNSRSWRMTAPLRWLIRKLG